MKTKLLLASALLLCGATNEPSLWLSSDGGYNWTVGIPTIEHGTHLLLLNPHWTLETNWVDMPPLVTKSHYYDGRPDNVETNFSGPPREWGTVSSNLLAVIEWKGRKITNILETFIVTNMVRSYQEKTIRLYEKETPH